MAKPIQYCKVKKKKKQTHIEHRLVVSQRAGWGEREGLGAWD